MYERQLTSKILQFFDRREVIFLLGTRQTGKTTLTRLLATASAYADNRVWYFDFEDKQQRTLFNTATIATLKQILPLEGIDINEKNLLVFDEVQLLDDPSNLLKLLHDHFPSLKIIATGSSSLQIKSKFTDSLAGRKRVYRVEPLSFDEFLLFRNENQLHRLRQMYRAGKLAGEALAVLLNASHDVFLGLFEEYLLYGGYPEVVLLSTREEKLLKLDSIISAYIQKDIRDIANIENFDAYNRLLEYLAINSGAQFNLSSAQRTVGLSANTLNRYLSLLQETFIVDELKPFFTNKNKEISKSRKLYYKDTGINNLLLKNFNPLALRRDAGNLYETHVFNALSRDIDMTSSLYFYRTQSKSEIDFIKVKDGRYSLYEIKAGKNQRIPRTIVEFERKYAGQLSISGKVVVNQSFCTSREGVTFLPAYLF